MKKNDNSVLGLVVRGSIVARTKREILAKDTPVEIVTYTVEADPARKLFVTDYDPDSYYEIGEVVELPVYVKPYPKKNGVLSYSLNIQKEYKSNGVSF